MPLGQLRSNAAAQLKGLNKNQFPIEDKLWVFKQKGISQEKPTQTHTHTQTHTQMHTHAHTHAHTNAHTHKH